MQTHRRTCPSSPLSLSLDAEINFAYVQQRAHACGLNWPNRKGKRNQMGLRVQIPVRKCIMYNHTSHTYTQNDTTSTTNQKKIKNAFESENTACSQLTSTTPVPLNSFSPATFIFVFACWWVYPLGDQSCVRSFAWSKSNSLHLAAPSRPQVHTTCAIKRGCYLTFVLPFRVVN